MSTNFERQNPDLNEFFSSAKVEVHKTPARSERSKTKEYSLRKTVLGSLGLTGAIVLGGGTIAGYNFIHGAADALSEKVTTQGSVVDPGKAKIVHVSTDMKNITLATAETKVTGEKVAFEQKLTGLFNISLGSNTVTRDATVETLITIDPGKVNVDYDSVKHKLIFRALDAALSTEVNIPTGEARTVDKTGNLAMLPAEMLTKLSEAVDGTFGTDNSKVPIIREMAAGTLNINEGLETYADLNIVTQVDQECTPLIPEKVKNFTEELKDNLRTAVQGKLLDPDMKKNKVSSALKGMTFGQVQKLVEDSTVEIPSDFTIGPDEGNIKKLEDYKKSDFLTSTLDSKNPIACGVSKNAKLSLVDKAGS